VRWVPILTFDSVSAFLDRAHPFSGHAISLPVSKTSFCSHCFGRRWPPQRAGIIVDARGQGLILTYLGRLAYPVDRRGPGMRPPRAEMIFGHTGPDSTRYDPFLGSARCLRIRGGEASATADRAGEHRPDLVCGRGRPRRTGLHRRARKSGPAGENGHCRRAVARRPALCFSITPAAVRSHSLPRARRLRYRFTNGRQRGSAARVPTMKLFHRWLHDGDVRVRTPGDRGCRRGSRSTRSRSARRPTAANRPGRRW